MSGHLDHILCVGNIVLDRVYRVEAIPSQPHKVDVIDFTEAGGGPAATAAVAVAALGVKTILLGRIGDDKEGQAIVNHLERYGIDRAGLITVPGGSSAHAAVLVDREGERLIAVSSGRNLSVDVRDLPASLVDDARAVVADLRWPEAAEWAFQRARAIGRPRVLDADLGDIDVIRRLSELSSHVIFSRQGLERYSDTASIADGLAHAGRFTDAIVGVTAGADGYYWLEGGTLCHQPAPRVHAVDTTGAGDVFHGAFAVALVERLSLIQSAQFASAAAAAKCAAGGGWAGVPDRSAVDKLMAGV